MGEFKRQDLFDDDLIQAPLVMANNMDKFLDKLAKMSELGKKAEESVKGATSTGKLAEETKKLTDAQTELEKIQKQFATSTQKLSDEYLANKRALNSVNDEVKKRLELGDREAKDVNNRNASLKQLETALNANRKAYAELSNQQERNSKSGKELLNIINSQDKSVKSLRDSMGQAQAHVGGYGEAIENALSKLGKLNPEMAEVAETGISKFGLLAKLISGPVIAGFAALFAVFKVVQNSLEEYTATTAEGSKDAKDFAAEWHGAQELIREGYIAIGRAIVNVGELNRTTGEGFLSTAARFLGLFDVADQLVDKTKEQIELNQKNRELFKATFDQEVKGSKIALEGSKALFDARDKIRQTDIERLNALDKAEKKIIEGESLEKAVATAKIESIRAELRAKGAVFTEDEKAEDLLKNKITLQHVFKNEILELGKAESELDNIEKGFFDSGRRRQQLRFSITEDIIKRTVEGQKIILEAQDKTEEAYLQKEIETNNRIVGNQEYSLEKQVEALQQNGADQRRILDINSEKEKRAALDSAMSRVEIDSKALREILDNEKLTNVERVQAVFNERVKAAKADEAYQQTVIAIDAKAEKEKTAIIETEQDKRAKLIVSESEYFLALQRQGISEEKTLRLQALNDQLTSGQITLRRYNIEKNKVINASNKEDLNTQVEFQMEELQKLKEYLNKKEVWTQEDADLLLKIEKQLADSQQNLSEANLAKKKKALEDERALIKEFQANAFASLVTYGNNQFAEELQQSQLRTNKLEKDKDKELELAGDNADAKVQIEQKYNKLIQDEADKNLKIRQRQARFDRDIAAIQVVVKTAEAIADQLPGFPFTLGNIAIITAIGALQEAAILSRPIPAYEKGTRAAVGGLSWVGEAGAELIKEPGKGWALSPDSATMMNIAKGSQVIPHEETMQILAARSLSMERSVDAQNYAMYGRLEKTITKIGNQTVNAIQNSKSDLVKHGSILYEVMKSRDGSRKITHSKSFF